MVITCSLCHIIFLKKIPFCWFKNKGSFIFIFLLQKEWPAKLRVVISKPRANTVLVRHYEIKQECHMVEIKANGDIWCDDQKILAAKEGTVMQFNCKTYNQKYWKKAKNSHFLPETVHISPTTATKFWVKEKSVVQNALLCCQVCRTHFHKFLHGHNIFVKIAVSDFISVFVCGKKTFQKTI